MRLDKFLTMQGRYTRAQAKALVRQGRVIVDGVTAADGGMAIDPTQCAVLLDGEQIAYCDQLHLMLNKPAGVLTAANDPRHRTVMDLLPPYCAALSCMPIGRLDPGYPGPFAADDGRDACPPAACAQARGGKNIRSAA